MQSRCLVEAEAALPAWPLLPGETTSGFGVLARAVSQREAVLCLGTAGRLRAGASEVGRRGPFSGRRKLVMGLWVAFPLVQTS